MNPAALRKEILRRGWQLFRQEEELNIVGLRSLSTRPNRFDDVIHVFYRQRNRWVHHRFAATTDPGTYWLQNPLHPQGTALLAEQQAIGAYRLDLHRGQYPALCQRNAPVDIYRDYNRDDEMDFSTPRRYRGYFGINIHRAARRGTTPEVDRHSAGCQVLSRAGDFDLLIRLCEAHRTRYGNTFTYSLIDQRAARRSRRARWLKWGTLSVASLAGLALALPSLKSKPT